MLELPGVQGFEKLPRIGLVFVQRQAMLALKKLPTRKHLRREFRGVAGLFVVLGVQILREIQIQSTGFQFVFMELATREQAAKVFV